MGVAEDCGPIGNRHGEGLRQLVIGNGSYFRTILSRTSEGHAKMPGKFLLSENFHCYEKMGLRLRNQLIALQWSHREGIKFK